METPAFVRVCLVCLLGHRRQQRPVRRVGGGQTALAGSTVRGYFQDKQLQRFYECIQGVRAEMARLSVRAKMARFCILTKMSSFPPILKTARLSARAKMARFFILTKMTSFPPILKTARLCARAKMAPFPKPKNERGHVCLDTFLRIGQRAIFAWTVYASFAPPSCVPWLDQFRPPDLHFNTFTFTIQNLAILSR